MEVRRRRVIFSAVAVVIVLVAGGLGAFVWFEYLRPLSFAEVLEETRLIEGTVRDLEGTITDVEWSNTTYGPIILVELDGNESCPAVFGDPSRTYRVGERLRITMRFREYSFNGDPAVWAPELACPFPIMFTALGIVTDAVSSVAGLRLRAVNVTAEGWTTYHVEEANGTFPAANLTAYLRRGESLDAQIDSVGDWVVRMAVEYTASQGFFEGFPEVGQLNLSDGSSERIQYLDANANGLVDVGDDILVWLEDTGGEGRFSSYFLYVEDSGSAPPYRAMKYILQGPDGPWEWFATS